MAGVGAGLTTSRPEPASASSSSVGVPCSSSTSGSPSVWIRGACGHVGSGQGQHDASTTSYQVHVCAKAQGFKLLQANRMR